jgi:hypothetical protein
VRSLYLGQSSWLRKNPWAANDPAYYESTWFIDGGYPKAASTDIEIGVDETQTTLDGFLHKLAGQASTELQLDIEEK